MKNSSSLKILVTGAAGYLGTQLCRNLIQTDLCEVYAGYHISEPQFGLPCQLNITDFTAVNRCITQLQPDIIIHTAYAKNPDTMKDVIVCGTENLARSGSSARFIAISTDFVFDGKSGPYGETDTPRPETDYGRYKLQAEQSVSKHCLNHLIIRTSLISGEKPMPPRWKNELKRLKSGEKLTFFTNEIRNPIHIDDLVQGIISAAFCPMTGILHIAGPRYLSRYEELTLFARWQNISQNLIGSAESDGKTRPLNCSLKIDRFKAMFPDIPLKDPAFFWPDN